MQTKALLIWLCLVSCCFAQRVVKQSTAYDLRVVMYDSTDHVTEKTGLTLTVTEAKSGTNSYSSISPSVTAIGNGAYNIALTTSHLDTIGDTLIRITGTAADPVTIPLVVRANVLGDNLPTIVQSTVNGALTGLSFAAGALDKSKSTGWNDIAAVDVWAAGTRTLTGTVTVGTNNDKTGYSLTQAFPTNFADLTISATTGRVTAGTVSDKTGYTLTQAFPTNFSSLGISGGGHIQNVDTLTTYTGNTPQTGDAYADAHAIKAVTDRFTFNGPTGGQLNVNVNWYGGSLQSGGLDLFSQIQAIQTAISSLNNLSQQNVVDSFKLAPTSGSPTTGSPLKILNKIQTDVNTR